MTNFDDEFQPSYADLVDHFGESVIYRRYGLDDRTITAIVDREPGEIISAAGEVVTYRILMSVHNDSTTGISSTELKDGSDKVVLARRVGATAVEIIVDQLISAEGGVCKIKVA